MADYSSTKAPTHVEFIAGLSWKELHDHLTNPAGHNVAERTLDTRSDVFTRRCRAERIHADLHIDDGKIPQGEPE